MRELTPRENDVAKLIREGLSNKAIAQRLSTTEGTVKAMLHSIYTKLKIENRTTLALVIARQSVAA